MYLKLSNKGTMHSKLFLFQFQKKKKKSYVVHVLLCVPAPDGVRWF